ncbi:short chain dehydrogenase [Mycobacterium sp. GA-1841]|uniref:SDR family oxidoreductase n=1 Tax=Mycobacterium sp. GA-1841 TaxID=1834154 RepID=UPI00096D0399|nr:NAD(P)-dependent oxidoreductase [Mycobacterium sp. GA-1841]OMC41359.1 short chain dehydrogenase [Mycobacterium sp. GA-1841]
MSLSGKTLFISGASRGVGLAIAKRAAADGANIALIAKTAEPHPKLPGTVYTAAREIEEAGGQALPIVGDIRDGDAVAAAVAKAVAQFGGIDICVNNASAINTGSVEEVPLKRFDLMNGIQVRGTYAVSQACIPHMKGRENPHILTLSPPIRLEPKWLTPTAYMMAKFGMSLCALALAEELRPYGIASNTLWPRTSVATAAIRNLRGGEESMKRSRRPEVYSDAAYAVLNRPSRDYTGRSLLCEDVLLESGVTDLSAYDCVPGADLRIDLWVDAANPPGYVGPTPDQTTTAAANL